MKQIDIARSLIGEKEQPGNKFDNTTRLGRMLKEAGHHDGEAWCCYAMEAVFVETLRALFSASTVETFQNFKNAGYEITNIPKVGALVIWQSYKEGKAQWQGHCGLVTKVNPDGSFCTIEGNTDSQGSRTGGSVQEKVRKNVKTDNGLNILGFVMI